MSSAIWRGIGRGIGRRSPGRSRAASRTGPVGQATSTPPSRCRKSSRPPENICAAIAVIDQESSFRIDPVVPGLPKIAWSVLDRRAERAGVPALMVHAARRLDSPDGRSYAARIDTVRTEKQLSDVFQDLIHAVPLAAACSAG